MREDRPAGDRPRPRSAGGAGSGGVGGRAVARRLAGLAALAAAAWLTVEAAGWPDVARLRTEDPRTTAFIERYRAAGRPPPAWRLVPASRISPWLKRAVIAGEDTEFFAHGGFSTYELRRSIAEAIRERETPRGASTLTQQLAKNLWLSPSRDPLRKAREAILTLQLEAYLEKDRILELYLNVVEFGPGVYGAEAAARRYFGKPAAALGPREAAMLAAGLPRPSIWNPSSESAAYARRVERLLGIMRSEWMARRFPAAERSPASIEVEAPRLPALPEPGEDVPSPPDTAPPAAHSPPSS